jgi:hypothetical protein
MNHLIHVHFGAQLGVCQKGDRNFCISPVPAVVELSPEVRSPSSFYFQFLHPPLYSDTIFQYILFHSFNMATPATRSVSYLGVPFYTYFIYKIWSKITKIISG